MTHETKHTPGPWTTRKLFKQYGFAIFHEAKPGYSKRLDDFKGEFEECDARLIAAAPELLEALECVNLDEDGSGFICEESMPLVIAAIAKARGQT